MVKRIFKIVAIVLAAFIGLTGAVVGIFALTGRFNKVDIPITDIYIGENVEMHEEVIKTLEDISRTINCVPSNATDRDIIVEINDTYGIIASCPTKIKAGQKFEIKLKTDGKGNNIGGSAVINFKVANGIGLATMTIIVDVETPLGSMYFTRNGAGTNSSAGKSFLLPISFSPQEVRLMSQLHNGFDLTAGGKNLKNVTIGYTYHKKDAPANEKPQEIVFTDLKPQRDAAKGYSYYAINIATTSPGYINIWAKMHKTSEIEEAYKFDNLATLMREYLGSSVAPDEDKANAISLLGEFNQFVNKYIKYFDTTEESYNFFKSNMGSDGVIGFDKNDANDVEKCIKEYIFVRCEATINVSDIELQDFTSVDIDIDNPFTVLSTTSYTLSGYEGTNTKSIKDAFGLTITAVGGDSKESAIDTMFSSLDLAPYLYLSIDNVPSSTVDPNTHTLKWANKNYSYVDVYGFGGDNGHTPILNKEDLNNGDNEINPVGYLIMLTEEDDYMTIPDPTAVKIPNTNTMVNKWDVTCNVPVPTQSSSDKTVDHKAMYIGFSVDGLDKEGNSISKTSFTRVFAQYQGYQFKNGSPVQSLAIHNVYPYMTISENITTRGEDNNSESIYLFPKEENFMLDQQALRLNVDVNATLLEENKVPTYTNVMYFVETVSNIAGTSIDGKETSKKVATLGKYQFINYGNATTKNVDLKDAYYMYNRPVSGGSTNQEVLIGERIPTYKSVGGNTVCYLQALNASAEPVKIFAVVYLSDKNGNPIDINGRKINYNEISDDQKPTASICDLVVMSITAVSAGSVLEDSDLVATKIESYADNINFYTKTSENFTDVGGVTFNKGEWLRRNDITSYYDDQGNRVDVGSLEQIQNFLNVKLLKDYNFDLYLTNYELDKQGTVVTPVKDSIEEIDVVKFNGELTTLTYKIEDVNNQNNAFENLAKDIENYTIMTNNGSIDSDMVVDNSNTTSFHWVIRSTSEGSNGEAISGRLMLTPTASAKLPYSNNLTSTSNDSSVSNSVSFTSTKLDIQNIATLDGFVAENKLQAQYAQISSTEDYNTNKGKIVFLDEDGSRDKMEIDIASNYFAETNLIKFDDNNTAIIEIDKVDSSQYVAGDQGKDLSEYTTPTYTFESIWHYVNYYSKQSNKVDIEYIVPSEVVTLIATAEFDNKDSDGKYQNGIIYFGRDNRAFRFEVPNDPSVDTVKIDINGYIKELRRDNSIPDDRWVLEILDGEYFPVLDNIVYIYGEPFDISGPSSQLYISKPYDSNSHYPIANGKVLSNGSTYNPYNYISSSIDKEAGKIYPKILRGEDFGNKAGVDVFLISKFTIMNSVDSNNYITRYKTMTYNCYQPEVSIKGANDDNTVNSKDNKLTLLAGETHYIYLGTTGGRSITESNYSNFFHHADYSIDNNISIDGVIFEVYSSGVLWNENLGQAPDTIKITLPHVTIPNLGFRVIIKYKFNGKDMSYYYYISIKENISVTKNDQNVNLLENYVIKLKGSSNTIFGDDANALFSKGNGQNKYFTIPDSVTNVKVQDVSSGTDIVGNDLSFDLSYATFNSKEETIDYEYKIYKVSLIVGEKEIPLSKNLKVEIIPEYIVDTSELNNITMFNGQNIYGTYLKMYEWNENIVPNDIMSNKAKLATAPDDYGFFTIEGRDSDTKGLIEGGALSNGIIKLSTTPTEDTTLNLTLSYTGANGTYTKDFSVKITGVTIVVENPSDASLPQVTGSHEAGYTITIDKGTSIDFTEYIKVKQTSTGTALTGTICKVDGTGIVYVDTSELKFGSHTYNIAYMKDAKNVLEVTNITFTIIVDGLSVSATSAMASKIKGDMVSGFEIEVQPETNYSLSNYFDFTMYEAGQPNDAKPEFALLLKNGDEYEVLKEDDNLSSSNDGVVYILGYVDSSGNYIETSIKIKVKVKASTAG